MDTKRALDLPPEVFERILDYSFSLKHVQPLPAVQSVYDDKFELDVAEWIDDRNLKSTWTGQRLIIDPGKYRGLYLANKACKLAIDRYRWSHETTVTVPLQLVSRSIQPMYDEATETLTRAFIGSFRRRRCSRPAISHGYNETALFPIYSNLTSLDSLRKVIEGPRQSDMLRQKPSRLIVAMHVHTKIPNHLALQHRHYYLPTEKIMQMADNLDTLAWLVSNTKKLGVTSLVLITGFKERGANSVNVPGDWGPTTVNDRWLIIPLVHWIRNLMAHLRIGVTMASLLKTAINMPPSVEAAEESWSEFSERSKAIIGYISRCEHNGDST